MLTDHERVLERRARRVASGNKRKSSKRYNDKLRADVIAGYGGVCVCCGTDYTAHLTLDHVNGGGNEHRRSMGRGQARLVYVQARRDGFPPEYQLMCFNCNSAKHTLGSCGCQAHAD